MEEITAVVDHITYQSEETGFTVIRIMRRGRRESETAVGSMPSVQVGESIRARGFWKVNPAHGRQFNVSDFQVIAPSDLVGIEKYLGSGLIKGIGPTYAKRIVQRFGLQSLDIIEKKPEQLEEIAGIGKKRIQKITACWEEQKSIRHLMVFLQKYGVRPSFAQKIFRRYGDQAVSNLEADPYCLARDIRGIGFKTADKIAELLGMPKDSPKRIESAVEYLLSELSSDGHVCYLVSEFLTLACATLEVSLDIVQAAFQRLEKEKRIAFKEDSIWLQALYLSEQGIARELSRIQAAPCKLRSVNAAKAVDWVQSILHLRLAKEQKVAVSAAVSHKIHIITGGPGTGKSTITKAILRITSELKARIILAAPTGRAAKRMSEICKRPASTIHSLLEYDFSVGGFKRGRKNPLSCDLIVVDEASMIDTVLMYSLLRAIPSHSRLLLVGDINQLPSVGPGNVLRDIIESDTIPVTELKFIFRQARGSKIIVNAHRINDGMIPALKNPPDSDYFFVQKDDKGEVIEEILSLVKGRLPGKYQLDPVKDIQVLSPMRRGELGIDHLNTLLQESLNSSENPLIRSGQRFHVGDKVMQLRNNYQREVYNGDVGYIQKIDQVGGELTVAFDDKEVAFDFSELDELALAYAVSIHKYQGSECPCVVIPVHTSHFKLLHRNLLYTGVTRGKKLVVLVGMAKALAIAVRNNEVQKRHTGLKSALQLSRASPSKISHHGHLL